MHDTRALRAEIVTRGSDRPEDTDFAGAMR
jgi:hypothetical protein